ncbi:MAG: Threonylcarbamoyl-AMP synthase [Chlamydiia bacterium]|nr:Threonylcarbamoyl-AMP synthase [Chlamydiia bacterium]
MKISLNDAKKCLLAGMVIAAPTDTVYGLCASIHSDDAVKCLYDMKQRPTSKPINILVDTIESATALVNESFDPLLFKRIADHFWPGPLTIVLPIKKGCCSPLIHPNMDTIGIRIPNHYDLLNLLRETGPLAVTSANISNMPSCVNERDLYQTFSPDLPILDGGPCQYNSESTIVALMGEELVILREGVVHPVELEEVMNQGPGLLGKIPQKAVN